MNVINRSMGACALIFTVMAGFTNSASAQAYFPQTLSNARRACLPARAPRYIPGRYETRHEQVRVPGRSYRVYVPPRYSTRCSIFGARYRRLVEPGHFETRYAPDRYEYRSRRIWVPGHYLS